MFSLPTFQYHAKIASCWTSEAAPQLVRLKWGCIFFSTVFVPLQGCIVRKATCPGTIELVFNEQTIRIAFESKRIADLYIGPIQESALADITDFYDFAHFIGSGTFSTVYCAIDYAGNDVAVKTVACNGIRESQIFCMPNSNPFVMSAIDVFVTPTITHMVLPLMDTDLLTLNFTQRRLFTETFVRTVMGQLLQGLTHLHRQGIVHCDLKPANILCNVRDDDVKIKIGDFGAADILDGRPHVSHKREVTTYQYCAPEQALEQPYGPKADIYAAGSIMYEISAGKSAFDGISREDIYGKILYMDRPQLPHDFSDDARNFLAWLHTRDESPRPTAEEALRHPWFR